MEQSRILCGLLGEHLGHSFSPQIHRELADYPYELYEVEREELGHFMETTELTAFNVTIPYKKDVIPYMTELTNAARRIGAVNTVTRLPNGGFRGDNTDYYGFSKMVEASGIVVADKKVLVLGTGGASVTVNAVLADLGARSIVSVSRTGNVNYENVYTLHADADVIVNTTPVGMYPSTGISPIRLSEFPRLSGVLDLIYNPARTALLLEAERLGLPAMNGLLMLVAQAKRASELFLDTVLDDAVIPAIVRKIRLETENLILIGMPGCGKSTAARLLSELSGREEIDTDKLFPNYSGGKSPAEMICEDGEPAFRATETEVVRAVGKLSGKIIATGGGVPTIPANYDLLHQNGIIVYLMRDLTYLPTAGRPISQGKGLEALYNERKDAYERLADVAVRGRRDPKATAKAILDAFRSAIQKET